MNGRNDPLTSAVIISINAVLLWCLSGSCSDLIDGLVKVDFLCSHIKPMTRSLADSSSFVPTEYVKGKGPYGP
jgi:hypothetical protein